MHLFKLQKCTPPFKVEKGSATDKPLNCNQSKGIAVSESKVVITAEEKQMDGSILFLVKVFKRQMPNELLFKIFGAFKTPRGVALDQDECIYVADSGNNRIVKFEPNGKYLKLRGKDDAFGNEDVKLRQPYGLYIKDKSLYVCDSGNSWIQIFDLDLNLLCRLGGQHADPRFLFEPVGIVYNPADQKFYVVDTGRNVITKISIKEDCCEVSRIQRMVLSDQLTEEDFHKLRGITVCNDYLLVTQVDQHFVLCLTVEGKFISKRDIKYPTDLAVYNDTVYACSCSDEVDAIQVFSLNAFIYNT